MTEFSYEYTVACNGFAMVANLIAALGFSSFFMIHCWNVYLDLFTVNRLSVSHRRRAPEITNNYKLVAYCTCMVGLLGCINSYGNALQPFVMGSNTYGACAITTAISTLMVPTKLFVYFVFSLRYQMVYGGSQYAIREGRVKFVNAFLASIGMFIFIWGFSELGLLYIGGNESNEDFTTSEEVWSLEYSYVSVVDYKCILNSSGAWVLLYAIFDVFVNIGFCYKFIKPIWQVIRLVQGSSRNVIEKSKLEKKMLFVGFKVFILSAVLFFSTILLVILYVGALTPSLGLTPVDQFINFLCLALMTPYYPDSKYYQRLCGCCIFCCDRKGYTKRAELNDEKSSTNVDIDNDAAGADSGKEDREVTEEQTVFSNMSANESKTGDTRSTQTGISVDTMSAIRIATNEEAAPITSNDQARRNVTATEVELAQNLNNSK